MNIWLGVILVILAFEFLLEQCASMLNFKAISPRVPETFKDTYKPEDYRRAQEYLADNTTLAIRRRAVLAPFFFAFLLFGGFNLVDEVARSAGLGMIGTGVLFTIILATATGILHLPFSIYDQFVVEEKYGFNKTTIKTFIADLLKSIILGGLIGIPLLCLILWLLDKSGQLAWLYCWLAFGIFQIIMVYLAPTLIMPLFNKFIPLEEGELKNKIMAYADEQGFDIADIYTMDGSRRSSKANAFFTGFGKQRRIVLFDTLVEQHSMDEVVAVLAHEIGHFRYKHIQKQFALGILFQGMMFWILSSCLRQPGLYEAFGVSFSPINGSAPIYAGLCFFSFIYAPISYMTGIIMNSMSRKYEFEADAFARLTMGSGSSLASALKRLTVNSLGNLHPHPLKVFLSYSHPPVIQRLDALTNSHSNK